MNNAALTASGVQAFGGKRCESHSHTWESLCVRMLLIFRIHQRFRALLICHHLKCERVKGFDISEENFDVLEQYEE